jgi:hypothetical protein
VSALKEKGENTSAPNGSCHWCGDPLIGKRPQAKFCSAAHRVSYSKAGKRGRLSTAERVRACQDCTLFGRSCRKHVTASGGSERPTSAHPHPLFDPPKMRGKFTPKRRESGHKDETDKAIAKQRPRVWEAADSTDPTVIRQWRKDRAKRAQAKTDLTEEPS